MPVQDPDDLRDRGRIEAPALQGGEHHAKVEFQRRDVDVLAGLTRHSPHSASQHRRIAQRESERHLLQSLERDRVDPPHRTEIDEPQRAATVHEDIPRMRIGVIDAIDQDLRQE